MKTNDYLWIALLVCSSLYCSEIDDSNTEQLDDWEVVDDAQRNSSNRLDLEDSLRTTLAGHLPQNLCYSVHENNEMNDSWLDASLVYQQSRDFWLGVSFENYKKQFDDKILSVRIAEFAEKTTGQKFDPNDELIMQKILYAFEKFKDVETLDYYSSHLEKELRLIQT